MKKLTVAELKEFRDRLYLPIPDSALEADLPPYYHPGEDSDEIQYMHERRAALGGVLPRAGRPRQAADAAAPTRSTTSCARARASRPWPPRWRSSGCSRT